MSLISAWEHWCNGKVRVKCLARGVGGYDLRLSDLPTGYVQARNRNILGSLGCKCGIYEPNCFATPQSRLKSLQHICYRYPPPLTSLVSYMSQYFGLWQIWKVQILKETFNSRVQVRLFLSRRFWFNFRENSHVARREPRWDDLPYQDRPLLTLLQL